MRAVLYSDQVIAANRKVDAQLLRMLGKPAPRIGYVPSVPDPERRFFREKRAYYAQYAITDLLYLEPDEFATSWQEGDLLACDAIHLTGGNTRRFLDRLRQAALTDALRRYAIAGGLMIGTSAGAILLTPTTSVDALFEAQTPVPSPEGNSLGLLGFEFFPHLHGDPSYLPALIDYSRVNDGRPIVACADGDGLIVDQGTAAPVGDLLLIQHGQSQTLSQPISAFAL